MPEKFLGLETGPSAVIRNAGGRAMDAMRSLQVLNTINPLGLIMVVHHTGKCRDHRSRSLILMMTWQTVAQVTSWTMKSVPISGKRRLFLTLRGLEFGEIKE